MGALCSCMRADASDEYYETFPMPPASGFPALPVHSWFVADDYPPRTSAAVDI